MSLEKIIKEAVEGNPLNMKEAFKEEMEARVLAAIEAKYEAMIAEESDEDEDEDDEDQDDDDDDDEDEDEDED
jgi:hypothetical protein